MRSPALLVLSLSLLASSGALGLLVHDGAVGTTEDIALTADLGSPLRLRGELTPEPAPALFEDHLSTHTVRLVHEQLDATVFITSDGELPTDGTWVVRGELLERDPERGVLLLQASQIDQPILFH